MGGGCGRGLVEVGLFGGFAGAWRRSGGDVRGDGCDSGGEASEEGIALFGRYPYGKEEIGSKRDLSDWSVRALSSLSLSLSLCAFRKGYWNDTGRGRVESILR
jgi:hypothetical protein